MATGLGSYLPTQQGVGKQSGAGLKTPTPAELQRRIEPYLLKSQVEDKENAKNLVRLALDEMSRDEPNTYRKIVNIFTGSNQAVKREAVKFLVEQGFQIDRRISAEKQLSRVTAERDAAAVERSVLASKVNIIATERDALIARLKETGLSEADIRNHLNLT